MTVSNIHYNISPWSSATYAVGNRRSAGGNAYACITAGTSTAAPTGTGSSINNGGTAVWKWLSAIDYTTLQAWANALPTTLTQQYVANVWGNGAAITTALSTPFLSVSGIATTSTNSLKIQAAESFRDSLTTGSVPLAFDATKGTAFQLPAGTGGINYFDCEIPNCVLEGLQFRDSTSNSNCSIVFGYAASGFSMVISGCLFDGYGQAGGAAMINTFLNGGTGALKIYNSVIIDRSATGTGGETVATDCNSVVFVNNTVYAPSAPTDQFGLNTQASSGTVSCKNNIFVGYAAAYALRGGGISFTPDHCLFSAASLTGSTGITTSGTGNLFSKAATNQFVSTSDLRLKAGADAINSGVADTTDIASADDIAHQSRSTWDIGAWEYTVAAITASGVVAIGAVGALGTLSTADPNAPTALRVQATVKRSSISASGSKVAGYIPVTGLTTGVTYTASIWVFIPSTSQTFTQVIVEAEGNVGTQTTVSALLTVTNKWQRISCTFTLSSSTTNIVLRCTATGSGSVIYSTCPQLETGTVATSYIPTAGTTVTRDADRLFEARGIFTDPAYSTLLPLFKGVQGPWVLSEDTLDIPLRDASYWLDRPIQSSQYLGTGTYEGTADLTGQTRPIARGGTAFNPICNVTPICIDPTNLIYQYTDGPGTVVNLYEGGATTITRQADTTNLYSGTTSAGQFRTDNSRGLFQLGSNPVGQITCDVTGQFPTAGSQTTALQVARYLMTETLGLPAAYIDTSNFTGLDPTYGFASGIYIPSGQTMTGTEALNMLLSAWGAKLYSKRDGKLRVLPLRSPSGTPVASFDKTNVVDIVPQALPSSVSPPAYRIRVGYNHNYTVQTSGYLASASAVRKQFVANADRYATAISSSVQAAYNRPNDPDPVLGALLAQSSASNIAGDLLTLWGVRRQLFAVTVPLSIGIQRDIGDLISLTFPIAGLVGTPGIIVGEIFRSQDSTTTFSVLV